MFLFFTVDNSKFSSKEYKNLSNYGMNNGLGMNLSSLIYLLWPKQVFCGCLQILQTLDSLYNSLISDTS